MLDDTESLDDLTFSILWESAIPTPLWEAFWAAQPDGDLGDVERVLDRLFAEQVFVFQRRPMSSTREIGELMSADEPRLDPLGGQVPHRCRHCP